MSTSIWLLSAVLALSGPDGDDSSSRRGGSFEAEYAKIWLIDEIDVAAEEAGLITELGVREGSEVKEGDKIAQISDSKARAARKVAQAEYDAALEEATNDISVRYADASAQVAKYDYLAHKQANDKARGTTPDVEMKKLLLQAQKGVLETEKAQLELDVAKLTAKVKEASVEAADEDIKRRRVLANFDAMVIQVYRRKGEWVNPGDPIVRVVSMNKVRIHGELKMSEVSPIQVADRPVTVETTLTGNRTVRFKGQVVFVAPEVNSAGKYKIIAEVENREERGSWLLLGGMSPKMTVDADIAAEKTAASRR